MMQIRKTFTCGIPAAIAFSLAIPAIARADQCALIPKSQALTAIAHLDPGNRIYEFCELCGDKQPRSVLINTVVLASDANPNLWEIKVNGKGIDLAYTYVNYKGAPLNYGRGKFSRPQVNLALISNCPADGYTPIISGR
jgi:hypothetical protein